MAVGQVHPLLRYIRKIAGSGLADGPTDGHLLNEYVACGNEAAFTALVKRHGAMVHGVCRRVLGNCHDADDAFQATFIVLMRKARRIAKRDSVGSWLHGVAYRTALKARAAALRLRDLEMQAATIAVANSNMAALWQELGPILDEEIARLPEKYRKPFVLCYLEGARDCLAICEPPGLSRRSGRRGTNPAVFRLDGVPRSAPLALRVAATLNAWQDEWNLAQPWANEAWAEKAEPCANSHSSAWSAKSF